MDQIHAFHFTIFLLGLTILSELLRFAIHPQWRYLIWIGLLTLAILMTVSVPWLFIIYGMFGFAILAFIATLID